MTELSADQRWELAKWENRDWAADSSYSSPYSSLCHSPLVIGGCPRSGSTLLRVLLGAQSGVYHGPESHLFLPLPVDVARLASRFPIDEPRLARALARSRGRGDFIARFESLLKTVTGARIWLDKTSRNVHVFPQIVTWFPDAWLFHIIRDPRDTILSLRTHPRWQRNRAERMPTNWLQPWEACISRWVHCVSDGLKMRGASHYVEVRYEELVDAPATVIGRIWERLGWNQAPLRPIAGHEIWPRERPFMINNLEVESPVTNTRVGRWREELPVRVLQKIYAEAGEIMRVLGYADD